MRIPALSLLPLLLSPLAWALEPAEFARACRGEKIWEVRLPWHTARWDSLPKKIDTAKPHGWVDDTTSRFVFVQCQGDWMQLLGPDGEAFWVRVPPIASAKIPDPVLDPDRKGHASAGGSGTSSAAKSSGGGKPGKRTKGKTAEKRTDDKFEPSEKDSEIDMGSGKVEGYLDNPSAVYILSEESTVAPPPPPPPPAPSDAHSVMDRLETTTPDAPSTVVERRSTGSRGSAARHATASGLNAGVSDDNRQFPAFLHFLDSLRPPGAGLDSKVRERIALKVLDPSGKPLLGARLAFRDAKGVVEQGRTLADGSYLFFPLALDSASRGNRWEVEATHATGNTKIEILRDGPRTREIRLESPRPKVPNLVVDLLFVLDVTGSMQGQIDQLKNAITLLQMNLSSMPSRPVLRFGLVQYQDTLDEFRVRRIPFTSHVEVFSRALSSVAAGGGGDTPEDLQSALDTALHRMNWSPEGIHLGFVVTDAYAHLDYGQSFTYVDAAHEARRRGIKFHTVGCGGLDVDGEGLLRQIAQATSGKYVFLTQTGEKGESDGGSPTAVSHHTGSNWVSERLETALLRLAREEIAQQAEVPPVDSLGWFEARALPKQNSDTILVELFRQAWKELRDFSSLPLSPTAQVAVLAPVASEKELSGKAARLGEEFLVAISRAGGCRLVDRGNLGEVLRELSLQHSGAVDDASIQETGKVLGAQFLITSGMHPSPEGYELILKLLKVSTGEVLSATRARIQKDLVP
ncbi:MAG: VWA domain-containing protein [Fibrobacteria bacterium]|nr:VWA domain-containing protein [Fibrobacteria bacterium]